MSNQRPASTQEFSHKSLERKKIHLNLIKMEYLKVVLFSTKKKIDFKKREKELLNLLEKHRGKHGEYDCIVPGSGGKR